MVLLEKSVHHHLFITHTEENDLTHYPAEACDESVRDLYSCLIDGPASVCVPHFFTSNKNACSLCLYTVFCLPPSSPLLIRNAHSCVYCCLFTIKMRDRVTANDPWWSKCLSLAPGYLKLKLGWRQKGMFGTLIDVWNAPGVKRQQNLEAWGKKTSTGE